MRMQARFLCSAVLCSAVAMCALGCGGPEGAAPEAGASVDGGATTQANTTSAGDASGAEGELADDLPDADNTAVNARDRETNAPTPFDQGQSQADVSVTANIRSRVLEQDLSINGHNVKIITQNGKVTLRGPVKTADEKQRIEKIAADVAGAENVKSMLEVERD